MGETPGEWVEMAWAARGAAHGGINAQRRARFEQIKALLLERDLPRSVIGEATRTTRLVRAG